MRRSPYILDRRRFLTGLGLAAVYGIVKGHEGYINVESKKERGTTFYIYLPAANRKSKK